MRWQLGFLGYLFAQSLASSSAALVFPSLVRWVALTWMACTASLSEAGTVTASSLAGGGGGGGAVGFIHLRSLQTCSLDANSVISPPATGGCQSP
ncbi:hypothetical protein D7V93_32990 [Corallococcus llansteffanensis]|uniref:Uncharacterized protein n=1 Tax=Corallococcus llansteffanensis TaxID=2316731 RepID=A0A3A8NW84_9BACT|nr:hypothetical protein D7V93_32990 [Corallococcus llansteffanensis]